MMCKSDSGLKVFIMADLKGRLSSPQRLYLPPPWKFAISVMKSWFKSFLLSRTRALWKLQVLIPSCERLIARLKYHLVQNMHRCIIDI